MAKPAGGQFETCMWLQLYRLHYLSDHVYKQETWTFITVGEEWESVEVWSRTIQNAWTYVTSCHNNPSQNLGASFHRFPSDRDRRARWLSMLGMNESQWGSPLRLFFQAPSGCQWQKRANDSLRSAPCMSMVVSITETTAVTFEV